MSWSVVVRPQVEADIVEAAAWYDAQQLGLGQEFEIEVLNTIEAIAQNPEIGSVRRKVKAIRWRYPPRFPYRIIYSVDGGARIVVVVAVLHAARSDKRWRRRA